MVDISNSYEKFYRTEDLTVKMLTEKRKDLQDMFQIVSFHIDTGLKPLSPLIDGPINDFIPTVWPYINQVLFQLVDVTYVLLLNTVSKRAPNSVIDRI